MFLPNISPTPCPTGHTFICRETFMSPGHTTSLSKSDSDHHISISLSQNNFNTSCHRPVCFDLQVSPHRHVSFPWRQAACKLASYHGQPYFPASSLLYSRLTSLKKMSSIWRSKCGHLMPVHSPLAQN